MYIYATSLPALCSDSKILWQRDVRWARRHLQRSRQRWLRVNPHAGFRVNPYTTAYICVYVYIYVFIHA